MKKIWYAPYKFESYGEEEIKAVEESLRSGWLGGQGPKSQEFEEKVSEMFSKKYGVFVNSGSSACLLALASLDIPKGSKVITPACTFSTTLAHRPERTRLYQIKLVMTAYTCFDVIAIKL